jgi:hypothetical protein
MKKNRQKLGKQATKGFLAGLHSGNVVPGSVVPGLVVPGLVVPGLVVPGLVVPGSVGVPFVTNYYLNLIFFYLTYIY